MPSPRPISPSFSRPSRPGRTRGFTLPELSLAALVLVLVAGSEIKGARMSSDQVARNLISSVTWLVRPSFQVSTTPLVE